MNPTFLETRGDTQLINVVTGKYPVSIMEALSQANGVLIGKTIPMEYLAHLNYAVVQPTNRPTVGDSQVAVQSTPLLVDGVYIQTWEIREVTADDIAKRLAPAKSRTMDQLNRLVKTALSTGLAYRFPYLDKDLHIQLRDKDRTNLMTLKMRADDNPGLSIEFRTFENRTVVLSSSDVEIMVSRAFEQHGKLLQVKWGLESQIQEATAMNQIPVLPENLWNLVS